MPKASEPVPPPVQLRAGETYAGLHPDQEIVNISPDPLKLQLITFAAPGQWWPHFLPGQEVVGSVKVEAEYEMKIIGVKVALTGFAQVSVTGGPRRNKTKRQRESYIDLEKKLLGDFTNPTKISAGVTNFPFKFQLPPSNLPCSYDGDDGQVEYHVKAVIRELPESQVTANGDLWASHKIQIDTPYPLTSVPDADSPVTETESGMISGCCKKGLLEVVVKTDKYGYDVMGDVVELEVSVNNSKSPVKVRDVSVSLIGTTHFTAEGVSSISHLEFPEQRWGEGVPAKKDKVWKTQLPVIKHHPQLRPTNLGGGCSLMDLEWRVRVVAEAKGRDNNVTVFCPIVLGTQETRRKSKD